MFAALHRGKFPFIVGPSVEASSAGHKLLGAATHVPKMVCSAVTDTFVGWIGLQKKEAQNVCGLIASSKTVKNKPRPLAVCSKYITQSCACTISSQSCNGTPSCYEKSCLRIGIIGTIGTSEPYTEISRRIQGSSSLAKTTNIQWPRPLRSFTVVSKLILLFIVS